MEYEIFHKEDMHFGISKDPEAPFLLAVDSRNKDQGKVFKRNAMHFAFGKPITKEQWLVGELNGVRVYVLGTGEIIMTTQDINYDKNALEKLSEGKFDG